MLRIKTLNQETGAVCAEVTCTVLDFLTANEGDDDCARAVQLALDGQHVTLGGGAAPLTVISHETQES